MTLKPCGFYCRSNSSSQPLKGYICYRQVISKFIKQYYILSSESWVKNIHIIKSESEKQLSCVRLFAILQARILEWVAFPFSRESSQPRDRTQVSRIAGGFFTSWATREAQEYWSGQPIPSLADLPDPGIKPGSPALQANSFTYWARLEASLYIKVLNDVVKYLPLILFWSLERSSSSKDQICSQLYSFRAMSFQSVVCKTFVLAIWNV